MMRQLTTIFIFIFVSNFISYSQPDAIWQLLQNGQIIRWAYSGGDEFNGNHLDESKWLNSYEWGRNYAGTCYQEYMTDGNNFEFENGTIKLVAKQENIYAKGVPYESDYFPLQDNLPNLRWWNYTSGMVFSKQKYKYGLFEIRFKLPVGKGLWPAFWLFGGNPNEEFDIFEYKGETPNKIHIDMHCPGKDCKTFGDWVTTTGNFSDGFNTMMGEWGPNAAFWYLNGQDFAIWLGNLNFQANIIANLGIANSSPCAFSPGPDNTTPFPAKFEIDYIRVWTRLNCDQSITLSNYSQTINDPTVITGYNINMNNSSISDNQYLSLIATNEIYIDSQTLIDGVFDAKVVDCPGLSGISKNPINELTNNEMKIETISSDEDIEVLDSITKPILYTKIHNHLNEGYIEIEFEGDMNIEISINISNSSGLVVYNFTHVKEKKLKIDTSKFAKGTYYLQGIFDGKTISDKLIIN